MSTYVLQLTIDDRPMRVITLKKAVDLLLRGVAEVVRGYSGRPLHSGFDFEVPAVIRLKRYVHFETRVKFNRANVLARDSYQCGYCGVRPKNNAGKPDLEALSIDHVVPRAQGDRKNQVKLPWNGKVVPVTCWENLLTACHDCNAKKGPRTPAEAGMKMRKVPKRPSLVDVCMMSLVKVEIPHEWKAHLTFDSQWADYWDIELDPS